MSKTTVLAISYPIFAFIEFQREDGIVELFLNTLSINMIQLNDSEYVYFCVVNFWSFDDGIWVQITINSMGILQNSQNSSGKHRGTNEND